MDKNDQQIMVVKREHLFKDGDFQGFKPTSEAEFESGIWKHHVYMRRGDAEHNESFKQPILYAVIINKQLGKICAYQRAKSTKAHGDPRIQQMWSVGIGGHVEDKDSGSEDALLTSMERELTEEIKITLSSKPKLLGYINDDSNSIGRVHIGLLYVVETEDEAAEPGSPEEIAQVKFMTPEEIKNLMNSETAQVETWSQIALAPIGSYIDKAE